MTEKTVYRMSSCGYCPRRLGYHRLGYKPLPFPAWLETSAEEGHWHEERIVKELEQGKLELPEYGQLSWLINNRQKEVTLEYPSFFIRGHIEGTATIYPYNAEKHRHNLFEIKSMSPFEFDRWMRGRWLEFPAYADQLTAYMEATKLKEALYIVKNRSTGYKDKQIITEPPTSFTTIAAKLTNIELAAQASNLISEEFDPNNWECKRCEYRNHCMPPLPILAEDQEKQLAEAVDKWRKGKALATEGYSLMDNAKVVLRGYAELTPTQKLIFNGLATSIYNHHSVSYPKDEVEKLLAQDILKGIAKIVDRLDCRIDDLAKKEAQ